MSNSIETLAVPFIDRPALEAGRRRRPVSGDSSPTATTNSRQPPANSQAVDHYKLAHRRRFITYEEMLDVIEVATASRRDRFWRLNLRCCQSSTSGCRRAGPSEQAFASGLLAAHSSQGIKPTRGQSCRGNRPGRVAHRRRLARDVLSVEDQELAGVGLLFVLLLLAGALRLAAHSRLPRYAAGLSPFFRCWEGIVRSEPGPTSPPRNRAGLRPDLIGFILFAGQFWALRPSRGT